jgi:hypothetical protein
VNSDRDSEFKPATGGEFDGALDRAEALLSALHVMRRAVGRIRIGQVGSAVAALLASAALLSSGADVGAVVAAVVLGVFLAAVLSASLQLLLIEPLMPRIRRDERAMIELVDTLRELFPHLARREKWSELRRYLVRTRLEQFPVGAKDVTR